MQENVKFLDKNHFLILKAIAIIAIIVGHIGNFTGKTWFTPLGGFGVAIFLFCSGYGLTVSAKNRGVAKYWLKKLVNVYLSFFIIEAVAALILQRDLKTFILDVLLLKPSHPYGWYMQYLFVCYLLFYIVFNLVKKEEIFILVFFLLGIISFFAFPNLQAEQALSFTLGIVLANYNNTKRVNHSKLMIIGIVLIFVGITFLAIKQLPSVRLLNHYIITLINLIIKLFSAIGVVLLSYSFIGCLKFLIPFGKISYELYLVHGYFIFCVAKNVLNNFALNTVLFLLITCAVSWAFYIVNVQIKKGFRGILEN